MHWEYVDSCVRRYRYIFTLGSGTVEVVWYFHSVRVRAPWKLLCSTVLHPRSLKGGGKGGRTGYEEDSEDAVQPRYGQMQPFQV
jgi:hypothetical protein